MSVVSVAERLKVLQRQSGRSSSLATADPRVELRAQLRRSLAARTRLTRPALPAPVGEAIGPGLHYVERTLPVGGAESLAMPWGDPAPVPRERLVCFDTETTGLAGGVGTKAFMIGVAQWRGASLVVRQLYLTALAGEAPMLALFAAWLPDDAIFVSYNGRSYDAPLLKGRYRVNGQMHPFEARRHVDLLHPVRRAYRGVWENCRLQTIERQLLGIVREDDLPGAEAPAAWLAYLRGQTNRDLTRVVDHNRQDVVTLARLLERLAETSVVASLR